MTREEIEAAPDEDVERLIFNGLGERLGWVGSQRQYDSIRRMSAGLRMLWSTDILDGEIHNGGFKQVFWNHVDLYAADAIDGFRMMGAEEHARLVEEALKLFEEEWPRLEPFYKEGTIEAFSKSYQETELNRLDDQWLFQGLDFHPMRVAYIRAHPEEFVLEESVRPVK